MDITSVSAALSSLKATYDLAKLAVAARDETKLSEITQALNERIMAVQGAALQIQERLSAARDEIDALKDEKRSLGARIAELEERKRERDRYRLAELKPANFAYAYVPDEGDAAPAHYICQPCMDGAGKKVVLQETNLWGTISLKCSSCERDVLTGEIRPV